MSEIVFPYFVRSCCCHAFWWTNKSEGDGASEVLGESCPISGSNSVNGLNKNNLSGSSFFHCSTFKRRFSWSRCESWHDFCAR